MDNDDQVNRPEVKQRRRNRLVESLASLRTEESADVCLTAGDKPFFVHKLVLEASSPFFISAIEAAEDGKVTFEEVEAQTLEIVLDYLYLGETTKLNTIPEVRKVMSASVLMDLQELYEYCATILMDSMDNKNFVEIWEIAIHFQHPEMLKRIHYYLVNNADELTTTEEFLLSSAVQVIDLMNFTKEKVPCFDRMFLALVTWIQYNVEEREPLAKELFNMVDPKLLSRQFLKSMLGDIELMASSTELFNRLNEMGVRAFVYSSPVYGPEEGRITNLPASVHCKNLKINFFCEYRLEDVYDSTTNKMTKRIKPFCLMQQFDLHSMTWQAARKICFAGFKGSQMMQHGRYIYVVGGALDSVYGIYDVADNSIVYVECTVFNGRIDAGLCVYKDYMYVIGGRNSEGALSSCYKVFPGSSQCTELPSLKYSRGSPLVLASNDYIYIIGGGQQGDKSTRVIEYFCQRNDDIEKGNIHIRNIPRNLPLYFTVSDNVLFGFYIYNNDLIRIWYNNTRNKWVARSYPLGPTAITASNAIAPTTGGKSLLFVSITTKGFRLPSHIWEPDTGLWTKLAPPRGRCELPDAEQLPFVYSAGL